MPLLSLTQHSKYRNIQQTTKASVVHIKSPFFARENSIVTQQPLSEIPRATQENWLKLDNESNLKVITRDRQN